MEVAADKTPHQFIQWQFLGTQRNSSVQNFGGTNFSQPDMATTSSPARSTSSLGQDLNAGIVNGTVTIPASGSSRTSRSSRAPLE